jgi:phosphoribosylaminoimidazole-succinocarboxamide synthase
VIIADTKFEFGIIDGRIAVIDEMLTPDSSRFWLAEEYERGKPQRSLDKQFVRDYLDEIGWDHNPPAPELPPEVVEKTLARYRLAMERLFPQSKIERHLG